MNRENNETFYQYLKRMVMAKCDGVWDASYVDWMNKVLGVQLSETEARKEFYGIKRVVLQLEATKPEGVEDVDIDDVDLLEELKERQFALDKDKIKLADERAYLNRMKRDMARNDSIGDYAREAASIVGKYKKINLEPNHPVGDNSGVLVISDWHFGIGIDNMLNQYSPEIAKERIKKLTKETINDIKMFNINEVVVCCLGDMISGLIHSTIRLENRIDVITQVIEVSQLIAEMLDELGKYAKIEYRSVNGNHDRVVADIKDSLSKENFSRMIDEYLKETFKNSPNVSIPDNNISYGDIDSFELKGWKFCMTHGDKGKFKNTLSELTTMLHQHYDVMLVGHMHHLQVEEQNETFVITNGCLCGTDSYAKDLRKTSAPSQNFIVVGDDSPCKYLHPINLK